MWLALALAVGSDTIRLSLRMGDRRGARATGVAHVRHAQLDADRPATCRQANRQAGCHAQLAWRESLEDPVTDLLNTQLRMPRGVTGNMGAGTMREREGPAAGRCGAEQLQGQVAARALVVG